MYTTVIHVYEEHDRTDTHWRLPEGLNVELRCLNSCGKRSERKMCQRPLYADLQTSRFKARRVSVCWCYIHIIRSFSTVLFDPAVEHEPTAGAVLGGQTWRIIYITWTLGSRLELISVSSWNANVHLCACRTKHCFLRLTASHPPL